MKCLKAILILFIMSALLLSTIAAVYLSRDTKPITLPEEIIPIEQEFTTAYLIKTNDGYLLFDTGYEKDFDTFKQFLKEEYIDAGNIRYLVLSHHHDDHSGYIAEIVKLNPSVRIIAHEKAVELLQSGNNNKANGGGIVNSNIYALFKIKQMITPDWKLSFQPFKIRQNDIIVSGENFQLPAEAGLDAVIIYTPGHSSDSISLLYKNKYLLCGDLASNFLNFAGAKHLTLFNENLNEVYKSWEKIIAADAEIILPSHGKPFPIEKLRNNLYQYDQKDVVKFF